MTLIDAILIVFYLAIFGFIKTKDSFVVLAAFVASVAYTSSKQWSLDPLWLQHIYIILCFAPALLFTSKFPSYAILTYMGYHWIVSGNYIFVEYDNFIDNTFYIVAPAINLLIMASLFYGRDDRISNASRNMADSRIHDMLAYKMASKET